MNLTDWTLDQLRSALQIVITERRTFAWYVDLKPFAALVVYGDGGQTYEAPYGISTDGTVTLGDEKEVRYMGIYLPADEVTFSAATDGNGRVKWSGLLFRAGRFPERTIRELTEADIAAMVSNFPAGGVPVHIDHNEDSFLADALAKDGAKLTKVWQQGLELFGEIDVPGWFAAGAREIAKSVSVGLDNTLQRLREISFVKFPRIEDAAVFMALPSYQVFAKAHPEIAATLRQSATQPPTPQRNTMKKTLNDVLGWFRKLPADQRGDLSEDQLTEVFSSTTPEIKPDPTTPQADPALISRVAELEAAVTAQASQFASSERANAALSFYESQLLAGKVAPVDRNQVIGEFSDAADVDAVHKFAADHAESRVKRLTDRYAAKPTRFNMGGQLLSGSAPVKGTADLGYFAESDFANAFGEKETKK